MKKICFRKITLHVYARIIGIAVCLLMIPAGILILIIDVLCQIINGILKRGN